MSKITDKLIDDIIELILDDMDCHHEVDHEEDGAHMSVEYSLKYELKVRNKIIAILEPRVTEEWIEEKAKYLHDKISGLNHSVCRYNCEAMVRFRNFIGSLVEEINK